MSSTADAADATPGNGVCATVSALCTLRAAIQEANASPGADTIVLPAGTYAFTIAGADEEAAATGDLDITGDLTITGAGTGSTIIDGAGRDRVFDVIGAITVVISGVTIQGGSAPRGGGIRSLAGTLTLTNVTFLRNSADPSGGGLFNGGTAALTNVAFTSNFSTAIGAAVFNDSGGRLTVAGGTFSGNTAITTGGGIANNGTLSLADSTFTDNSAPTGGGIQNSGTATITNSILNANRSSSGGGISSGGTATLTNVTISGNTASSGGGIFNNGTATLTNVTINLNEATASGGGIFNAGTARLRNTIVANSVRIGNCDAPVAVTSLGRNIDSGNTCAFNGPGDLISTDPRLSPLANNGGPSQTHALLLDSPAIDRGDNAACPATDQRGFSRPGGVTTICDIGAYELGAQAPTPTPTPTPTLTPTPTATPTPTPRAVAGLVVGWNNVLYNGSAAPVEGALGNCLASVEAVFSWNATAQVYSWWFKGALAGVNSLTALNPGLILWVQASAGCPWQQT